MVKIVNIFAIVGVTLGVCILGIAGGYFIWFKSRPSKMTWTAEVYQAGEGIKPFVKDQDGCIISKVHRSEIKAYTRDVIEKIEKGQSTIYQLVKMKKTVPAVTNDCVDYWGPKDKRVAVLLEGDTCTLMKKGYDRTASEVLFHPMQHDRINMIKSEIALRKDRNHSKKDILVAISPWVITALCMITLMGIAYTIGGSYVEISENLKDSVKIQSEAIVDAARINAGQTITPKAVPKPERPQSVE